MFASQILEEITQFYDQDRNRYEPPDPKSDCVPDNVSTLQESIVRIHFGRITQSSVNTCAWLIFYDNVCADACQLCPVENDVFSKAFKWNRRWDLSAPLRFLFWLFFKHFCAPGVEFIRRTRFNVISDRVARNSISKCVE